MFTFNEIQLILSFMAHAFGIIPAKSLPHSKSSRFSHMLSYRNFKLLCSTFRSMIHFELIFVKSARSVFWLLFSCRYLAVRHHLLRTLTLLHCSFASLLKVFWLYLVIQADFCRLSIPCHWLFSFSFTSAILPWESVLQLYFSPSVLYWLFWVFCLFM